MTKIAKLFFIYSLYLILAVSAYVLFYLYIENKNTDISETLVEIVLIKEENAQMKNLEDAIKETADGREKLSSYFVDSNAIIEFLEQIEGLGDVAGVDIDVKSINESDIETENIKGLNLSIDFEGEWTKVHHFLVLLENMPIQMTTNRLNFREGGPKEEGGPIIWNGSVDFSTLQLDS